MVPHGFALKFSSFVPIRSMGTDAPSRPGTAAGPGCDCGASAREPGRKEKRPTVTTEEIVSVVGSHRQQAATVDDAIAIASALYENLSVVVRGAHSACVIATTAVLATGHLLIDDVPGVGKTMLAKAVAASIGARLARIQGHPDLLPSDITGVSVYNQATEDWEFRPGPVFAHVVLFDELNRTPPRSQAALLESMEEGQVTVDGASWPPPLAHLVLATQNPIDQAGTYPLVESQMDRFLLADPSRLSGLGHRGRAGEVAGRPAGALLAASLSAHRSSSLA